MEELSNCLRSLYSEVIYVYVDHYGYTLNHSKLNNNVRILDNYHVNKEYLTIYYNSINYNQI